MMMRSRIKKTNNLHNHLSTTGMNGDIRSPTDSSSQFGQQNGMGSRLPSTNNERKNGFGSYLDQISRGDSQKAVNGDNSGGSGRTQGSPSAWNATGLSDPDSWDPRDFDPLTQSLSGRSVSQPTDDKRQPVPRSAPPSGASTQSRLNMGPPSPINQSQQIQNRTPPTQRVPSNSQRPQDRNGANQSVPPTNQADRKSTWTPTSNSAPYTNPSTLMPTDVAQLSQPPLQGEAVQQRQERRPRPERPLPQSEKKATWTPPSNNAPYTNPSTLMPTDVTPVDGDSYLGSLSSSSTSSTRPRGSYNPFGRPIIANTGSAPTPETTMSNRQRTDTPAATRPVNNVQANSVDSARNSGRPNARTDSRSQPEAMAQRTPERASRQQAETAAPVPRSESPPSPAILNRAVEPARDAATPQRAFVTPSPARRTQSPLVPADLIRPVEPDITSVTRASSGRSDAVAESRTQPSSLPRNGFFPQQTSQATRERNGENASNRNAPNNGLSNGENVSRSRENAVNSEVPSDTRRVDTPVGPDQPRTNRTPWISSGSSNEQSDYNPRNFDPRTQSFRETLGPNSRARQNGPGQ